MTLPVIQVEADGELEIPASLVGGLPIDSVFFVQEFTIPEVNTVLSQKIFLLIQRPTRRSDGTVDPQDNGSLVFPVAVPQGSEVFAQEGFLVISKPVANLG